MAQALAEKLQHNGPSEKGESGLCHKEGSWQVRQSRFCQKEKSRLSRSPDREVRDRQDEHKQHLGEKEGDQSRSMERKG